MTSNMAAQKFTKQGFTKSGKPAFHRDIVPIPGNKFTKSVNLLNHHSLNRVPDCTRIHSNDRFRSLECGEGNGALLETFDAYVRRARWEGWLSFREHEREDLGDRVLREGFQLLYNRTLHPDPKTCWKVGIVEKHSAFLQHQEENEEHLY